MHSTYASEYFSMTFQTRAKSAQTVRNCSRVHIIVIPVHFCDPSGSSVQWNCKILLVLSVSVRKVTLLGRSGDMSIKLEVFMIFPAPHSHPPTNMGWQAQIQTIQQIKAHNTTIDKHIFCHQGALASFHLDILPSREISRFNILLRSGGTQFILIFVLVSRTLNFCQGRAANKLYKWYWFHQPWPKRKVHCSIFV